MTRKQAYAEMQKGRAVDHVSFNDEEYLWMDKNGHIRDDIGCYLDNETWGERVGVQWDNGWRLI